MSLSFLLSNVNLFYIGLMSFPYPYKGPIAPENNPKIEPQYFKPSRFVVSNISLGFTTTVTTSVPHNYIVGQLVRLFVPIFYGTFQLNEQQGYVISIPAPNQVVVDINSLTYSLFISSPAYANQPPQIISLGDISSGAINNSGRKNNATAIPGSFVNISPL